MGRLCIKKLQASYAIYVGKNLTKDGSVLISGSGDEVSSHWLEVVPRRNFPAGTTISVGVDETANMLGRFIEIPQVTQTHRYLTMGEATRFVTKDWQIQEATEFAGRTFKRLMYFTCDHAKKFLPEVTEANTAFEDRLIEDQTLVEKTSDALFDSGQEQLALKYLTERSNDAARSALALGNALLGSIAARTQVLYGLRAPENDELSKLDYQMVRCD